MVTVVTATRGERGVRAGSTPTHGIPPGEVRAGELADACRILGIGAPIVLDFPDAGLAAAGAALAHSIRDVFGRLRPEVVLTLGWDGVYGSVDHRALTAAVADAVKAVSTSAPSRVLHAVFPRGLFAPVWRRLRRWPGARLDPSVAPADLGVARERADLRIDLGAVRAEKRAAIAAHRTQLVGDDPASFLGGGLLDRLLAEEWFVVDDGRDLPTGATDPFAGL